MPLSSLGPPGPGGGPPSALPVLAAPSPPSSEAVASESAAPGAAGEAADGGRQGAVRKGRGPGAGRIKRLLPQTLFGRSLLIIVTPVVLAQIVAAWIFYDRHWQTITRRLVFAVVGEIALVIDQIEPEQGAPAPVPAPDREVRPDIAGILEAAARHVDLMIEYRADRRLPRPIRRPQGLITDLLARGLTDRLRRPFAIAVHNAAEIYEIEIELTQGSLRVTCPQRRLFSPTAHIFILWMVGSALILVTIALVFMRNQIRPIRRLAAAAESFGKGRDVMDFRLEGAREVRQAAQAFLDMRDRIRRQIHQRTVMLAGVSHDLRTPLTRMKLQLALLPTGPDIEELKRDVAEMEAMVEGYLAFARGEAREPIRVTNLSRLVAEVVADARRAGGEVFLEAEEDLTLPLRVNAFQRCLTNLLSNARRHALRTWVGCRRVGDGDMESPGVVCNSDRSARAALACRLTPAPDAPAPDAKDPDSWPDPFEEAVIEITVDDDGPGIPAEAREDVFKPFFRLDSSRNIETGGAGLGLTIARDVVRGLGGDLTLHDSPRGGLRAVIRLPL